MRIADLSILNQNTKQTMGLCEDTQCPYSKRAANACENAFIHSTSNYGARLCAKCCKNKNIKIIKWVRNNSFFFYFATFCCCTQAHSHSHNMNLITCLGEMSQNGLLGSLCFFSPSLPGPQKSDSKRKPI